MRWVSGAASGSRAGKKLRRWVRSGEAEARRAATTGGAPSPPLQLPEPLTPAAILGGAVPPPEGAAALYRALLDAFEDTREVGELAAALAVP